MYVKLVFFMIIYLQYRGSSMCNSRWSLDHPDLQKKKKNLYILVKKYYTKLTYFEHFNKNVEHPNLRITGI